MNSEGKYIIIIKSELEVYLDTGIGQIIFQRRASAPMRVWTVVSAIYSNIHPDTYFLQFRILNSAEIVVETYKPYLELDLDLHDPSSCRPWPVQGRSAGSRSREPHTSAGSLDGLGESEECEHPGPDLV